MNACTVHIHLHLDFISTANMRFDDVENTQLLPLNGEMHHRLGEIP